MKLKNRLKILLNNGYILLLCLAIIVSVPLQFFLLLTKGKNRILKYLEDRIYKTLFCNHDLKKNLQRIKTPYHE